MDAPWRSSWPSLVQLNKHYDRRGQYDIALNKIDEAISHTLTVIDLYSVKHVAALADEARSMDLAGRYLNSECVVQMLQADQVGLAEKTVVLFIKDGDQHNNLHDMQCMWIVGDAVGTICRCYMKLHDYPTIFSIEGNDEISKLPHAQRKK
ncbi:Ulp1 protease family C-terminal catalytic domain containing protein expressed [Zea mays]|uniref:Ulp1 protease family C-terminal catalytic domain containing protein expressed n=1 Tax=Zea mays TaxID=4577 RepID=A0A1D6N941_MAIZE|nr:Ulp1 protease family C-terminal catalytic domain containing protein expressed [Zea mays]